MPASPDRRLLCLAMADTRLFIWNDRFVYAAPKHQEDFSVRCTSTMLIALDHHPICLKFADGTVEASSAMVVAPRVARRLACDGKFVSLNFDPQSYENYLLLLLLKGHRTLEFCVPSGSPSILGLEALANGELDCGEAHKLSSIIASDLITTKHQAPVINLRILSVARRIKSELPAPLNVDSLANYVGLSPDWLGHLFAEQMGVSMKSYMVWAKMRKAATLLQSGSPLADIAAEVGFSDAAHLSRAYKRFFGLSPSSLADPVKVQLVCCET